MTGFLHPIGDADAMAASGVALLRDPDLHARIADAAVRRVRERFCAARIVPMYERARSITPKMQRRLVAEALGRLPPALEDPLPAELRARLAFPDRRTAIEQVHFPQSGTPLDTPPCPA